MTDQTDSRYADRRLFLDGVGEATSSFTTGGTGDGGGLHRWSAFPTVSSHKQVKYSHKCLHFSRHSLLDRANSGSISSWGWRSFQRRTVILDSRGRSYEWSNDFLVRRRFSAVMIPVVLFRESTSPKSKEPTFYCIPACALRPRVEAIIAHR